MPLVAAIVSAFKPPRRRGHRAAAVAFRFRSGYGHAVDAERVESVRVPCEECGIELAGDSPALRLELTCDDELLVYCEAFWERELATG